VPAPTELRLTTLDDVCDAVFTLDGPACLGIVRDGRSFALRDGPRVRCVDDLIGFGAPDDWCGVAFVADGRGVHLDDGGEHRLRLAFALTRDGHHASMITSPLGADRLGGAGHDDDRPAGHLADLCHRALGLDAAPERSTPDLLDHAAWLERLLAASAAVPDLDLDDWSTVVSHHPAFGRPVGLSWADAHRRLVELGCGIDGFTPEEVAWMDAPTLARYLLDGVPRLQPLLDALGHLVSTSTMDRVHATLREGADSVRAGDREGGE
jgi:hypothetical protein